MVYGPPRTWNTNHETKYEYSKFKFYARQSFSAAQIEVTEYQKTIYKDLIPQDMTNTPYWPWPVILINDIPTFYI